VNLKRRIETQTLIKLERV